MSISGRDLNQQRQASLFVVVLMAWFGVALAIAPPSRAKDKSPTAAFTVSPESPAPEQEVRFDASASKAADGDPLVRYEWDLDGDGTYETDTGTSPLAARSYPVEGTLAVGLRVTDDDKMTAAVNRPLTVALAAPGLGVSLRADPVEGTVLVGSQPLGKPAIFPIGSTIDATNGRVRLTFATAPADQISRGPTQTAVVHGGKFAAFQSPTESLVVFRLVGDVTGCAEGAGAAGVARVARAAKAKTRKRKTTVRKRAERRLWVDAEGSFRTEGRNAAAVVRGTEWLTQDECDGTLVRVARGTVQVRDHVRARDVAVKQGQEYFARDACASRRNFTIHLFLPPGARARSVEVTIHGQRVPVTYRGGYNALIDLRKMPKGQFLVHIRAVLADGSVLKGTRSYHTCADRVRKRYAPAL